MKLSKYTHIFKIDDVYAYYNSLNLNPVYLKENQHLNLKEWNEGQSQLEIDGDTIELLIENKILVDCDEVDTYLLIAAQNKILTPYPTVVYFILSENCNLACKYCFLGNAVCKTTLPSMSKEVAEKALEYYSYQIKLKPQWYSHQKEFIFYGGEPLLNFETLKCIINKTKEMQADNRLPKNIKFSMVTNGLLLDEIKIQYLKENKVFTSVSIDGATNIENSSRIDKSGMPIFDRLMNILELVKKNDWNIGLSITLTPNTLNNLNGIFNLLSENDISDISFNILHLSEEFHIPVDYYEKANNFIIDFFLKSRGMNIFEDRIMRKLDAFVKGEIYYSDCAATSGSQIVVLPSGKVGVCHGCIENKEYFCTDIDEYSPLEDNPIFVEWSRISPLNQQHCEDCEALGICGGGCPINARNSSKDATIHSIDQSFCVHSKKILRFLVEYLYRIYQKDLGRVKNG